MSETRHDEGRSHGPISDDAIVVVLRPFVRATRPVLAGLRESDPFGLRSRVAGTAAGPDGVDDGKPGSGASGDAEGVDGGDGGDGGDEERRLSDRILDALASLQVPGTAAWASMDTHEREHWWVYRVGRFTTLIASIPGLGGALARTLPVSAAIGAAGQGMLLVAIAGEHGVTDEDTLVKLVASVLFRRDVRLGGELTAQADAAATEKARELTGDLDGHARGAGPTLRRVGSAVWRLGRALYSVEDELDKRPHGRFYHEWVGLLPVVGVLGKYLGEWSGLKQAASHGRRWLTRRGLTAD